MPTQPHSQQRPEPFHGVDMHFTKTVAIVITGIFTRTMASTFVLVAPCLQATIDIVRIAVDQGAWGYRGWNQRLDRHLWHVGQHPHHDGTAAFDHAEDRRFLALECAASPCPLASPSSAGTPFLATLLGWPLCPATI